jgi:hypothetical protein
LMDQQSISIVPPPTRRPRCDKASGDRIGRI